MIQKVLSGIGGIGLYGVISILLFFGVFVGVLVWAMGLRRPYIEHMSRLPLEDGIDSTATVAGQSLREKCDE